MHKRPSLPERQLISLIERYSLPYRYVGDGQLIIGNKNPDFVHTSGVRVVEVYGRAFHDPELARTKFGRDIAHHQTYNGAKEHYARHGLDCVILWDDEVCDEKTVLERLA